MKHEDIIKLAREADLVTWGFQSLEWEPVPNMEAIERFAALVAAKEREECAKVFDEHWRDSWSGEQVAAAIRARGD